MSIQDYIEIIGAREHNLKNVSIRIPKNKLVVMTGLSGSGKSSLAFDTIYAEGQRRYVESLSGYAKQFLDLKDKPEVEYISGLSPAIAINQENVSRNPRSTVATMTEIYDYLRLLYARIGVPYSPATGLPIESQSPLKMLERIKSLPCGTKIVITAPICSNKTGEFRREIISVKKKGYNYIMVDGELIKLDKFPTIDPDKPHKIDAIIDEVELMGLDKKEKINGVADSLLDAINRTLAISNGIVNVNIKEFPEGIDHIDEFGKQYRVGDIITMSDKYCCPKSGFSIPEITPKLFSFNSPFGACSNCSGLGVEMAFDPELIIPNEALSIADGVVAPWSCDKKNKEKEGLLFALCEYYHLDPATPWKYLPEDFKRIVLYGTDEEIEVTYHKSYRSYKVKENFEGVINDLYRQSAINESEWVKDDLIKYQSPRTCNVCKGYRLSEQALAIKLNGLHIGEVCRLSILEAVEWFRDLPNHLAEQQRQISEKVLGEIISRLDNLINVGLEYLSLSRKSQTLSGGEHQRVKLATQISSGLSGILYVLDEPSIGLHQSDNRKLINTLKKLRDLGNTVIVAEHDEETMLEADYLVEVGPGAGIHGGNIIAAGTPEEVINNPNSLTGQYLSGRKTIPVPDKRRIMNPKKVIIMRDVTTHNLQHVNVNIPLGLFCSITGVSGGGKSSLIIHTLYQALNRVLNESRKLVTGNYESIEGIGNVDKIIKIDQSPIGRTPRSNPCTYVGIFSLIREKFASLPEAKARGYKVGRFSFNIKGGRCEACQGDGMNRIEMHFLPDVYVVCDVCHGKRYNRETLEIKYKGKSIFDILDMTVEEAKDFFEDSPYILEKVMALYKVGLGYVKLGQSATTLSGGETQRIKLAKELSKKATGNTIYILDEPTTGLHFEDIKKLLDVLHELVDHGNSVVVIEHNLDVIKTSDWIIDVGPGGGIKGGRIVAEGTPEDVAKMSDSPTAVYLAEMLEKHRQYAKRDKTEEDNKA